MGLKVENDGKARLATSCIRKGIHEYEAIIPMLAVQINESTVISRVATRYSSIWKGVSGPLASKLASPLMVNCSKLLDF